MQNQFLELAKVFRKTTVFITHDLDEAIRLGDRIAIMKDGRIVQIGTPEDIVTAPADDYVADFVAGISRLALVTAAKVMKPLETERALTQQEIDAAPKVSPDDLLDELVTIACETDRPIVVVDSSNPVGIITKRTLLQGIQGVNEA